MQARRKAILCLCYDQHMLRIRQMVLEHSGYTVLPTSNVEDAKNVAMDYCPDMLLMDNSHPGVDFEQLATQVKRTCPQLIAVVLSPYYGIHNGSGGAIDRYVAKDDGPDALLSQIEELFGKEADEDRLADRPM